jgi:hypothetical protein
MTKKIAVLWPYKFSDFSPGTNNSWEKRFNWIVDALIKEGYEVQKHPDFIIDVPNSVPYIGRDNTDIVVYNHADISEIRPEEKVIKAKKTWFFKPTVPDKKQCTLDELGYGSYSTPTYEKPDFENIPKEEVATFFKTVVKSWKTKNESKWGRNHFTKKSQAKRKSGYYLILGQVFMDSVVARQDWYSYSMKLEAIVQELVQCTDDPIVVKLHPYTNGEHYDISQHPDIASEMAEKLKRYSPQIEVITDFTSVHSLLPKAKCVFVGNTGAGFEAMMHRKPIISFCFPEYHWVTYDLRKVCDIHRAIKTKEWFNSELSDKYLYWYMRKYCFYDEKSAHRRVKELLNG